MFGLFSKGKIEISLQKYEFSPEEIIEGTLTLKMKKPVEARALNIGLIGKRKTVRRDHQGRRTVRWDKIFDFKKPIDKAKTYDGTKEYTFQIKVPKDITSKPKGVIGSLLKSAELLSGQRTQIKWFVTANLDKKGLDISKKVQIRIV